MASENGGVRVLLDGDTVLRALLRRAEVIAPKQAFILRPNERGLSVNFDLTPDQCRAQEFFKGTHGVRRLLVQSVKALNLDVIPDGLHHANITGIPNREEDSDRAEYLAAQLLQISELVSEGFQKNPFYKPPDNI